MKGKFQLFDQAFSFVKLMLVGKYLVSKILVLFQLNLQV